MALGAYSIVRYSNDLNDQRVNLGVIVWHPIDGFASQFSSFIDRVQSIDPRVRVKPIREQLKAIEHEIGTETAGCETLDALSKWFRHGLEVSEPYPARMQSIEETLGHFFELLVSPVEEIRRASSQRQFASALKRSLKAAVKHVDPKGDFQDYGRKQINGVAVDIGLLTTVKKRRALWRALSLQAVERAEDQVSRAKATAMDCHVIRALPEFRRIPNIVVLQRPKPRATERFTESVAWLKREAREVIPVTGTESLASVLTTRLVQAVP